MHCILKGIDLNERGNSMRYDFITNEILQNHKFFEIQFDDEQYTYVHGDHSISIPTLGTQFYKLIGKKRFIHRFTNPCN